MDSRDETLAYLPNNSEDRLRLCSSTSLKGEQHPLWSKHRMIRQIELWRDPTRSEHLTSLISMFRLVESWRMISLKQGWPGAGQGWHQQKPAKFGKSMVPLNASAHPGLPPTRFGCLSLLLATHEGYLCEIWYLEVKADKFFMFL